MTPIERVLSELVLASKAAQKRLSGENIMGGCSACGTESRGAHRKSCIVVRLGNAIASAETRLELTRARAEGRA